MTKSADVEIGGVIVGSVSVAIMEKNPEHPDQMDRELRKNVARITVAFRGLGQYAGGKLLSPVLLLTNLH